MAAARTESKMYGFIYYKLQLHSDFVTNSYGESWDSSCEQIMSPSPEPWSPSSESQTDKKDSVVKQNQHSKKCASLENSHKNGHRNHRNKIF